MTIEDRPQYVMFGSLRSGTTMFRLMLDAHPDLVCPGEADFLTDHLVKNPQGEWRYDLDALSQDRIFRASRARMPDTDEAMAAFRQMTADLVGDDRGALVIVAHRGLDRLLDLCRMLSILHVVRDPRDVARSAVGMGWAGNVFYGVDTWLKTEREWQSLKERFAPGQCLEVHYETLVRTPEETLTDICRFLGRDYDPAMTGYVENSSYDRPDPALAEQWRRKLSAQDIGLVEYRVGDLLEACGYSPNGRQKDPPGVLMRVALWVGNKRGIWAWRVRRHGLRDPLLSAVARRLRLPVLAKSANFRMAQTNNRLRK
jgi:hypothetical protein